MFDTHKLNEKGFEAVKDIKFAMNDCMEFILDRMPEGREKSIFKTKIEEAMFFGTKAVASHPDHHTEVIKYQN